MGKRKSLWTRRHQALWKVGAPTEKRGLQGNLPADFRDPLPPPAASFLCQALEHGQPGMHSSAGRSRRVLLTTLTSLRGKTARSHIWVSPKEWATPTTWQVTSTADQLQCVPRASNHPRVENRALTLSPLNLRRPLMRATNYIWSKQSMQGE